MEVIALILLILFVVGLIPIEEMGNVIIAYFIIIGLIVGMNLIMDIWCKALVGRTVERNKDKKFF